jgi:serine/threonine protein kinase
MDARDRNPDEASLPGSLGGASAVTRITPGAELGPYKIEALLGAGGMGQVFRARDTRLGRTVAIKVLPHDKVADPERKRRFLQEARAASALNHPNIVTLHDIASASGVDFLVMEHVVGKSLDKLITSKGLPLPEALDYAAQIANALAAAHTAGVTHRDIKPANVIVTQESQVKILDFGLAKLTERTPGPEGETLTAESALTEAGTVMGTVAYMSPEQASARPLDHRTDIFSLGIVLYEMIAGKRPFRGASHVETMHAIIHDPAPPLEGQPPELEDILAKALAKDPRDRYQHSGDFALDLRRFQRAAESKTLLSQRRATPQTKSIGWVTAAAALVIGIPAAWWFGHKQSSVSADPLASATFTRLTDFEGCGNISGWQVLRFYFRPGRSFRSLCESDREREIQQSDAGQGAEFARADAQYRLFGRR